MAAADRIDPAHLPRRYRTVWDAGYSIGYRDGQQIEQDRTSRHDLYRLGYAAGWAAYARREQAAWAPIWAHTRALGGPFSHPHAEMVARRTTLPADYRPKPTYEQCMASWDAPTTTHGAAA